LTQQLAEARKTLQANKKAMAESKKEIAEEKRRFRNWRARHPEDPLSIAFKDAKGNRGKTKARELDNLLRTYLETKSEHRTESQDQLKSEERAASSATRTAEASHFEVCGKFSWDPFANNDDKFEKLLAVNELKRRRLPAKHRQGIEKSGLCSAATYKYEHTTKWTEQSNMSREQDTFRVRHDVSAMAADEKGERLKRFFSSVSLDMLGKVDSKLLPQEKPKKISHRPQKVVRRAVL